MLGTLFKYHGIRVRQFYQKIKAITFFMGLLPFLVGNGYYHYLHYLEASSSPIAYGIKSVVMILVPAILIFIVNRYLYERTVFFGRFDNLRVGANFLVQNGYYLSKKSANGRERIKLPKVYIKRDKFGLDITFILQGNKFQDRFNNLNSQLELMFDGDFMSKTYTKGFVTYTIVLDHIKGRLTIDDVKVDDNGVRLMEDVWWNWEAQPHLLIGGGTGGGKTVLLMSLLKALLSVGYVDIGDPKKLDLWGLRDIPVFRKRVFSSKEDIINMLVENADEIKKRGDYMSRHPNFTIGKNYAFYGLKPKFVLIDEWAAFMAKLEKDYNSRTLVEEAVTSIVLEGRQAGVFLILGMQRPDGEFIKTSLRDNFMKRISVGHLEDMGYRMMFGGANETKVFKKIDEINGKKVFGRGYVANNGEIAQEFFAPFVPFADGYSFIDVFSQMEPLEEQDLGFDGKEESHQESVEKTEILQINDTDTVLENRHNLKEVADSIGASRPQVFKILKMIEDEGYTTFERDDNDQKLLSVDEVALVKELFEFKATNDLTWSNAVEQYFTKESED